jgi:hypothetical protein
MLEKKKAEKLVALTAEQLVLILVEMLDDHMAET